MTTLRTNDPLASLPWYKQRWPWLLMSGPAVVVVAGLFTAYLAVRSSDGLVDENYYKSGEALRKQAHNLNAPAELQLPHAEMAVGADQHLRVFLSVPNHPATVLLKLTELSSGVEQTQTIAQETKGVYVIALTNPPVSGKWRVHLEAPDHSWRMESQWEPAHDRTLHLAVGEPTS